MNTNIKKCLMKYAELSGIQYNHNDAMMKRMEDLHEWSGVFLCPCQVIPGNIMDAKRCPCTSLRLELYEHGNCHCGLFSRVEKNNG